MKYGPTGASRSLVGRRQVLKMVTLLAAAACSARTLAAVGTQKRSLAFVHLHTGERLETVYWLKGKYRSDSLHAINHIFRDHRADAARPIDLDLLDLLYQIKYELRVDEPFQVISAYRTPATNAWLRQRRNGVASRSFHMLGKAVDLRLSERSLRDLRQAALTLQAGGVGYYPARGFVHLDVGPVRNWRG
nr:DUF882 domain-containing protein [Gammaproteobacteria bacterium]